MNTKQPIKINNHSPDELKENSNLWNYADLSSYLKLSENTLRKYVMNNIIPYYKINSKAIRFKRNEIDLWLEKQSSVEI